MPPIVLIADLGWFVVQSRPKSFSDVAGQHGYTPDNADMNAFFVASGPAFPRGTEVDLVHTIDIYALMCYLIGLPAQAHNGSLARISRAIWGPN
ncbi:Bis(5'-adenosyl)-triphosphatase enpp4 [Sparganum proliferum]